MKISLNAFDKTYEIIGFKHSMFRYYDSNRNCYPKSGLVGGFFEVEFASDADVSFLEKMVMIEWGERNFEKLSDDDYVRMNCFSGKLSCQFDETASGKVYEWEYAIVAYYEEIMHSFTGEPMKTRVVFSPFDLRVNNLLISRYSGNAEKGTWYFYEPEEEIEKQPVKEERILAIKTIECLTKLDCIEGKEGVVSGKSYTFQISEYKGDSPTDEEMKNIIWDFSYIDENEQVVVGTKKQRGGDIFIFDTNEHSTSSKKITVYAYFSDRNQEAQLEINVINEHCVMIGFEVNNSNAYEQYTYQIPQEVIIGTEIITTPNFVDRKKEKFHIDRDTGHAFYYLSKHGKVEQFLSFGPTDEKEYKHAYDDATPDYHIPEEVRLFKIPLTFNEYQLLNKETAIIRKKIISGKAFSDVSYNVFINDTCASLAKEILDKAISYKIPKGKSVTAYGDVGLISVINPYAWYEGFKKSKWAKSEKVISANENLWQQIMIDCQTENKPDDPYNRQ